MKSTQNHVEAGFGHVADAFHDSITDSSQDGASLSVWLDGKPAVELAAGTADMHTARPFTLETLAPVFSCSKGLSSILIAKLIEEGRLPGFDSPITAVWPEFGKRGKERATIGDVLSHRGGVSAPRFNLTKETVLDELAVADLLAEQEPLWPVPEHHQYHPITFGPIAAKLVHIATGRRLGEVFAEEIARPLNSDTWFGLPQSEFHRVAHIVLPDGPEESPDLDPDAAYWFERARTMADSLPPNDVYNQPDVWGQQLSGAGAISSATGLARIWSATVTETDGIRILSSNTVEQLQRPRSVGEPYFSNGPGVYQSWGAGVMIPSNWNPYLSPSSFGHDGAGGHVAFADSSSRLGFAYVTNRSGDWSRGIAVIEALRRTI